MYTPNVALRRALLERLKSIGMCADLHNDQIAVKDAAERLGLKVQEVERELNMMRMEHSTTLFRSFGLTQIPQRFMASLVRRQQRLSEEQRARSQSMVGELIADLDGFDIKQQHAEGSVNQEEPDQAHGSQAWLERMRHHPEFLGDRELEARHP